MKIAWKNNAKAEYFKIARYINEHFCLKAKFAFVDEVNSYKQLIKSNPEIGRVDPLFKDRAETYRSVIINKRSKLVYRVDGDIINIVAFWDCRRDPVAQAKRVK